ncbi:MAG: response regulator [Faecalibacterium sp.]|jgi:CheY-like chemotaxis protein|nr:response regulator [Faecalibacterium sp.]
MAENNTVLLFGYSGDFFDALQQELSVHYYVRAPGILLGLKEDLEKGSRPLAIVIYLQSMGTSDFVIVNKLLKDTMSDIPMIMIGSKNECGLFCMHVASLRRYRLLTPCTVSDVSDTIAQCRVETQQPAIAPKKILLVDDDRLVLSTLRGYLGKDYTVAAVATGIDALNYMKTNHPDLILMDYFLPVMNGQQVVQAMRNNCVTATIPFIFLTANTDRATVMECLKLKPAGYLVKPIDKATLLSTVEQVFAAAETPNAMPGTIQ